ncbi:DUF551 domain-containing protein [Serratia sp. CY56810]|uniref:DUF551 domain-containing protein n=1 Tax=Serratia sp. CY56810 TaxID=3383642 RepID=UPI003F9F068A
MALKIERLKWLHDAATELSVTKLKMTMRPDELLVLTSELLANRESQPVGYIDPDSLKEYRGKHAGGSWSAVPRTTSGLNMTVPIYLTAPPAPAMVGELLEAMEEIIRISDRDHIAWARAKAAISACRTAILQHVSQGYKLAPAPNGGNSPEIPDGWIACSERMPELDKRVLLYFGSYDGHIEDGCIGDDGDGPYHYLFDGDSLQQEPTHWMPLPAAPEGGNG